MGKGLNTVFKTIVKDILQDMPRMGESGSEFSLFISNIDKHFRWHKETLANGNSERYLEFNE